MRVLHLGKYAPSYPGGIESYFEHLLTALEGGGVEVHGLVHAHERHQKSTPRYTVVPTYGRLMFTPISPQFPLALNRTIDAFNPDLLHIHMPNVSAFSVLRSRKARVVPWVVHWHADVAGKGRMALDAAYRFYRYFERRLLARSAAIIVTSPPYLDASEALQAWRGKAQVISLGCAGRTPIPGEPIDGESYWSPAKARVLFVGRASYYKGLECLLEATGLANNIYLIIVGPGTRASLQADVERHSLQQRVRLLDQQPADVVSALMSTADCLCLPSTGREEAFGMAAIEAMMHGTPVLAANISGSGLPWVVEPGVTGELVPVGDAPSLGRALESIHEDPVTWARMGKTASSQFDQRFHIRHSASDVRRLYETLLSRSQE